ncbi:MAG: ArnT family glycosyltransferase [Anaerolineae bacterium]
MAYGFKTSKSWFYGLLGIFVILGLAYGLTIPLFESSDEFSHLQVIRYFANERTLPPPVFPARRADSGEAMAWVLTFHSPPLYYAPPLYHALGAALTFWAPMEDLPARLIPNPGWEKGWSPESTTAPWNKNIYVHLPDETLAQSATVRATIFLRLVSLLLAWVPVVCAYKMALLLWPERPLVALTAAGFVALNPQYIATAASVTNDLLLCALFSLAVLAMVKAIMGQESGWRRWALLGGGVGMAILVKQSALLLLPLGAVAILWQTPDVAWRHWRKWLLDGAVFGLAALCVGGWWYALNGLRYGDLLGTATHLQSQVPLAGFDLRAAASTFRSYWAAFGWGIPAPAWFYWMMGSIVTLSLLGIVKSCLPGGAMWALQLPIRRSLLFLGSVVLLNTVAFVRWAVFPPEHLLAACSFLRLQPRGWCVRGDSGNSSVEKPCAGFAWGWAWEWSASRSGSPGGCCVRLMRPPT